jgi:phosphoribosyl-AMP cyclohydrolase
VHSEICISQSAIGRGGIVIEIDFEKGNGLIPVIIQEMSTNEVLMVGYMNREAWEKTLETKRATFWSRSRKELWVKGETSGHFQEVREIYLDCDGDTLLLKVDQIGKAACHTGFRSCFHHRYEDRGWTVSGERIFDPKEVYKK